MKTFIQIPLVAVYCLTKHQNFKYYPILNWSYCDYYGKVIKIFWCSRAIDS